MAGVGVGRGELGAYPPPPRPPLPPPSAIASPDLTSREVPRRRLLQSISVFRLSISLQCYFKAVNNKEEKIEGKKDMYSKTYRTSASSRKSRGESRRGSAGAEGVASAKEDGHGSASGSLHSRGKRRRGGKDERHDEEDGEEEEGEEDDSEGDSSQAKKKQKTLTGAKQLQRSVSISRSPFLACVWRPSLSYLQKQPQCSFDKAIVPVLQQGSQVSAPVCHLSNSCAQSLLPTGMGSSWHERAYWAQF